MQRKPIILQSVACPYKSSWGYVYLLVNSTNGHRYVGKHIYKRKCEPYIDNSYWASGGSHLQNALAKLNGDKSAFIRYILDWVEWTPVDTDITLSKRLADLEEYHIYMLGTWENPDDYNETPGGDGWKAGELNPMYGNHRFAGENHPLYGRIGEDNPRYGTKHTDLAKQRMSVSAKQRIAKNGFGGLLVGVQRFGPDNPFYGRHHTEEAKQRIREANTGRQLCGKDNGMYGRHHTEEAKQRIREANTGINNHNYGKPMSDEVKQKQRESHLGKKVTPATRQLLQNMWTKPINAFNSEGVLVKEFPFGALSIGRNFHISGKKIWELCCNNLNEIYEGYIWKFA